MWRCGWVPNPCPGAMRSSLSTRIARKPMYRGSMCASYVNVWRLSSHPIRVCGRSPARRMVITQREGLQPSVNRATRGRTSACRRATRRSRTRTAPRPPSRGRRCPGVGARKVGRQRKDLRREERIAAPGSRAGWAASSSRATVGPSSRRPSACAFARSRWRTVSARGWSAPARRLLCTRARCPSDRLRGA